MSNPGRNMYVFREGRQLVPSAALISELAERLQYLTREMRTLSSVAQSNLLIEVLLRAGELECALADLGSAAAGPVALLTESLARRLVSAPGEPTNLFDLPVLPPLELPATLPLSPPEGFAFYALHPLDFADMVAGCEIAGRCAAVVGIRSIGSTLSAVVMAALERRGVAVRRLTVRPKGHPYDRRTEFDPSEREWVARQQKLGADFLVVDEGPGMSGSSFLSVGEALRAAGAARVQFLCSRQPNVNALCAREGSRRWSGFRALYAAPATHLPAEAKIYLGGGYWRHELMGRETERWPASWSQMERLKFLTADRSRVFKFEGFGRFGAAMAQNWCRVSESGFAPAVESAGDGFLSYPFVRGDILAAPELDAELLERMADYCAFRSWEFRSAEPAGNHELEVMLRFNVAEEFGVELGDRACLPPGGRAVLVDGRMLPHKWIRRAENSEGRRYIKCDVASHGDDHFFPGRATDIAWDLAGTIVEWNPGYDACRLFLARYRRRSGDDVAPRLASFLLAYAVFRMAYSKMAAAAMQGSEEEPRLLGAYHYYRAHAARYLATLSPAITAQPQEPIAR